MNAKWQPTKLLCEICLLYDENVISVCMFSGMKLQELTNDYLPDPAGQISMRNNQLAVPGWNASNVCIFNIDK